MNEKAFVKYRIAIIAGQLVVGGAERQLYVWLSRMDRNLFEPVVLSLHPGHNDYWEGPIEKLGIRLDRVPYRTNQLLRAAEIIQRLRSFRPHLVQGWHSFASPYAGLAAKMLGAKSVGGIRGSIHAFLNARVVAATTLFSVDAMLVNSRSVSTALRNMTLMRGKPIYAVQNAIDDQVKSDPQARQKLSAAYCIDPDGIWLGSVGRLDPQKRYDLLLRALALLCRQTRSFRFILIGDGPERANLESLTHELALQDVVVFAGEIPEAASLLNAFDIFCFTSVSEGTPNAVMEAAVAGLPIVGWQTGFMNDLLDHGRVAWLVETGNLAAFCDAVFTLVQSPQLRDQYGKSARDHMLENFSVEQFIKQMTTAYTNLLGISSPVE